MSYWQIDKELKSVADAYRSMYEAKDLNKDNVDQALRHDCATHVEHADWGKGECISEQHTLEQVAPGEGVVTHYDVQFEHGIEENVAVEDLTILSEMSHGHKAKKKNEAMDPVGAEDGDVDNDGDEDKSDKYLKKRRKTIKIAMNKDGSVNGDETVKEGTEGSTHETEAGHAKITPTHVHFDNSGYKQKFTHKEIHHMNKGGEVRGFTAQPDDYEHRPGHTHVYSNGDEDHHLPVKHFNKAAGKNESRSLGDYYQGGTIIDVQEGRFAVLFDNNVQWIEEAAEDQKAKNLQKKIPGEQEKLEPRAKGEKDFVDSHKKETMDGAGQEDKSVRDIANGTPSAKHRPGDKVQSEPMKSVEKTTGQ